MALLGCIQKPSKWSLHAVYPPLETYVSGNIALIGDSVCTPSTSHAKFKALSCSLIPPDVRRRMPCYLTLEQVLVKDLKMHSCSVGYSANHRRTHQTLQCVYRISTGHSLRLTEISECPAGIRQHSSSSSQHGSTGELHCR